MLLAEVEFVEQLRMKGAATAALAALFKNLLRDNENL
jgi:hypothetical protein